MLPVSSSTNTQSPSIVAGARRWPLVCSTGLPPLRTPPVDASTAQTLPPEPLTDPAKTTPPALAAGTERGFPMLLESEPNAACQLTEGCPQPGSIAIRPGGKSVGLVLDATGA